MNKTRIRTKAKEVIKKFGLTTAPVDVRTIVKKMGILLVEAPNEDGELSGLILRNKESTLIGVNKNHHENRKRFTIAHELGHYLLHEDKDVFVDKDENLRSSVHYRKTQNGYCVKEEEANIFAAELLMPETLVRKDFNMFYEMIKERFSEVTERHLKIIIELLSEQFQVSKQAMEIRIDTLKLV